MKSPSILVVLAALAISITTAIAYQQVDPNEPGGSRAARTHNERTEKKAAKKEKAEPKVRGCIRSEGSKYSLEDAKGQIYTLNSTENLSSYVGHEVVVRGAVSGDGGSGMSKASTAAGNKEITVSTVDTVSDTCKLAKHGKVDPNDPGGAKKQEE